MLRRPGVGGSGEQFRLVGSSEGEEGSAVTWLATVRFSKEYFFTRGRAVE